MKSGITLWIILGTLIAVVVIFLIVASIIDRKKSKKLKLKKEKEKKEQQASKGKIAIAINIIIKHNNKLLNKFVPSVGKIKMSDIKNRSKKSFNVLENSHEFKLFINSDNKEAIMNFYNLRKTNSNLWKNHCKKEIKYFSDLEKKITLDEKEYKKNINNKIKEVFK